MFIFSLLQLDDWVICRIYEKALKCNKSKTQIEEDEEEPEDENELEEHLGNQEEPKHERETVSVPAANINFAEYTEFGEIVAQPIDYYCNNFVQRDFHTNNMCYEAYLTNYQLPIENQLVAMDNQNQILDYHENQDVMHDHLPALINDTEFGMFGNLSAQNMVDPPNSIFSSKYLSNTMSLQDDQKGFF